MFHFILTSARTTRRPVLAAGLFLLSTLYLQAQRTTLVTEGFTGTGVALNDTTADTFSESLTLTGGSPTWVAATNFLDNGGVNSTTGSRCAYLNLGTFVTDATGTPEGKFELTMTIAPVTGAWISLGFAAENTPNLGKNFTNSPANGAATTGVGTVIYRSSTSSPAGELDLFGGPGNTSSLDGPDNNTGNRQLTVSLDLTPNGGYDGITHFGTVTWSDSVLGVLGIHTFTSLRNFGSLLISVPASSSGTVSALTLSQLDGNNDTTAPALQFTVPAAASTGSGTAANLAMSFNEVVKAGTGTITLRKTTGDVLVESFDVATSPQLSFSGGSMIIDPASNLLPGVQYYVLIPSGAVQDTSGNPYAGITAPGTWSFTTDSTPPALTGTAPANQAASIPVQANLVFHFDEPVQTGSGTISVHDAGTGTVLETIDMANPGAVTVSGRSVLITRTVPLAVNTTCYVRAGSGTFTDLSGLPWAGINNNTTLTFTTWAAAPLIAEYFFGVGGPLAGTEADAFDASISSVGGSGSWLAAANHLDNGSISTGVQTSAYLSLGTFLNNELGAATGLFDLTMTLSPVTGAWISLGFAAETNPNINKNFTNNGSGNATNNGLGTLIYRAQSGAVAPAVNGELDLFGEPPTPIRLTDPMKIPAAGP